MSTDRIIWQGHQCTAANALAESAISQHGEAKTRAIDYGTLIALLAGVWGLDDATIGGALLQEPFSVGLALARAAMWVALIAMTLVLAGDKR